MRSRRLVRRTNDSFLYRFKVEAINARYWLASAFEMAAVAPGIPSSVLAHRLSDCVGLDCLGGVSPGQASATDPSGAVRSDLACSLRGNLCAGLARNLACSRRAGCRTFCNNLSPHACCRLQCWLVYRRHGRAVVALRMSQSKSASDATAASFHDFGIVSLASCC